MLFSLTRVRVSQVLPERQIPLAALFLFIHKFHGKRATFNHSHIVCGYFCATKFAYGLQSLKICPLQKNLADPYKVVFSQNITIVYLQTDQFHLCDQMPSKDFSIDHLIL
jgi:hypothetical protein